MLGDFMNNLSMAVESCELDEEDTLSTASTIDYSYPEEKYPREDEEDDEEEDSTPTEENIEDEDL
ncbi:hypothetical protein MKW92_002067, partial [Papaver armeniacum]